MAAGMVVNAIPVPAGMEMVAAHGNPIVVAAAVKLLQPVVITSVKAPRPTKAAGAGIPARMGMVAVVVPWIARVFAAAVVHGIGLVGRSTTGAAIVIWIDVKTFAIDPDGGLSDPDLPINV